MKLSRKIFVEMALLSFVVVGISCEQPPAADSTSTSGRPVVEATATNTPSVNSATPAAKTPAAKPVTAAKLINTPTGPVRGNVAAGRFYNADKNGLRADILTLLKRSKNVKLGGEIVGLIVPHAGYNFSGEVAAAGYRQLVDNKRSVIILVGGHEAKIPRARIWAGGYQTPLGVTKNHPIVASKIADGEKNILTEPRKGGSVHLAPEHTLEVQIPFLQVVFGNTPIVPIYFNSIENEANAQNLGLRIAAACKNQKPLLVCSADLSHYPDNETAVKSDTVFLKALSSMNIKTIRQAEVDIRSAFAKQGLTVASCSTGGIMATIAAARAMGANYMQPIAFANSSAYGTKNKERVVGYAAVALIKLPASTKTPAPAPVATTTTTRPAKPQPTAGQATPKILSAQEKVALLRVARNSILMAFAKKELPTEVNLPASLKAPAPAFVTINNGTALRGCIGSLRTDIPLWRVVANCARSAAFADKRFKPLTQAELAKSTIEISVLNAYMRVNNLNQIKLGTHGVIISSTDGKKSGIYLPEIGLQFKTAAEFLSSCAANKAGLEPTAWQDTKNAVVFAFTTQKFREPTPKPTAPTKPANAQ